MKEPGWTYLRNNMLTEKPVAYFVNKKGFRVFCVVGLRDCYITIDVMDGIKPYYISYSDARKLNSEEEENQEDSGDVLFSALVHACEKFEENYNEQVDKLLSRF